MRTPLDRLCGLLAATALTGCPEPTNDEMVALTLADGSRFWIDKYEYPNRQGQYPERGVNQAQAEEKCAAAGKRLCTAREWRRACQGPGAGLRYGYGERLVPNICRVEVGLPGGHTSLTNAGTDPSTRGEEGGLTASGSYWDCATAEGVHDLIGNLEEWVLDADAAGGGGLEGGAWYTRKAWADCSGRYSRQPDYRLDPTQPVASAGFRCCKGPEPDEAARAADHEARLATARERASAVPYEPTDEVPLGDGRYMDRFEYPNRRGEAPTVGVTWDEARSRCAAHGKRLCGTAEWEAACSGMLGHRRPYGDVYVPAACGVDLPAPGTSGSWLACVGSTGAQDLVGSVWEWTVDAIPVEGLAPHGAGVPHEVRGGSWFSDPEKAVCRPSDGYPAVGAGEALPDLGFRCCRGPEPAPAQPEPMPGSGCTEGMVKVGDTCMDVFEHPNQPGETPRGQLDWSAAQAACAAVDKTVCAEATWVAACEGSAQRRWPTGDTFPATACNVGRGPSGGVPGEPRPADPAGTCTTPEGVHDLSGNVWEWVAAADGSGVLRGGGWDLSAGFAQCRVRATPPEAMATRELGVRCCAPLIEPGVP